MSFKDAIEGRDRLNARLEIAGGLNLDLILSGLTNAENDVAVEDKKQNYGVRIAS